jgi:predicted nicotinamide N-methyase
LSREAFVLEHTQPGTAPLVPEIELRLATEVTPLWTATQSWLDARGVEPPYWAFAWAGGQALARYVLDHPELVRGRRVVDFATGSGIVAIAAARAGASSVVALDVDPLAVTAARLNAARAGAVVAVLAEDRVGDPLELADIVLAGDVFYDATASARHSTWFRALARAGKDVVVGDPGRAYLPSELERIGSYQVATSLELEGSITRTTVVARYPNIAA